MTDLILSYLLILFVVGLGVWALVSFGLPAVNPEFESASLIEAVF